MQTHFGMIQFGSIAAVALLVEAFMMNNYLAAVAILISAFVVGSAYLIGVAGFEEPHAGQRSRRAA
ncbi:MAG TPA: hypothetical protein VHC69_21005 [Polyangiaceae bacterium]|nr:hypothetical protein [Polyangiaceae bacterium]